MATSPFGPSSILLGGNKAPATYNPQQQLSPLMSLYMSMPKQAPIPTPYKPPQTPVINPAYHPQQQVVQPIAAHPVGTSFLDPRSEIYDAPTFQKVLNSGNRPANVISPVPPTWNPYNVPGMQSLQAVPQTLPQTQRPLVTQPNVNPGLYKYISH